MVGMGEVSEDGVRAGECGEGGEDGVRVGKDGVRASINHSAGGRHQGGGVQC